MLFPGKSKYFLINPIIIENEYFKFKFHFILIIFILIIFLLTLLFSITIYSQDSDSTKSFIVNSSDLNNSNIYISNIYEIVKNNYDIINLKLEIEKQKKQIELFKLNNGFNINFNLNKVSNTLNNTAVSLFNYNFNYTFSLNQNVAINFGSNNSATLNFNNLFYINYYNIESNTVNNTNNIINPSFNDNIEISLDFSLKKLLSNDYNTNLSIMEVNLNNLEINLIKTIKKVYLQFLSYIDNYYSTYQQIITNKYNLYIEQNTLNSIEKRYSVNSYNYKNQLNKIKSLQKLIEYENKVLINIKQKIQNLLNQKLNVNSYIEKIINKSTIDFNNIPEFNILEYSEFKNTIKDYDDILIIKNTIKMDNLNKKLTQSETLPDINLSLNYNLYLTNIFSDNFSFDDNMKHSISLLINYSFDINQNKRNKIKIDIDSLNESIDKNNLENMYRDLYETYLNLIENNISIKNEINNIKNNLESLIIEIEEKKDKVSIFGEFEINRLIKQKELYEIQLKYNYIKFYNNIISLNFYLSFLK